MNDKWWERMEKVLDVVIVVGVIAMTVIVCFGVVVVGVAAIRYVFLN